MGWRQNSKSKTNVNKHGTVHGAVFFLIFYLTVIWKKLLSTIYRLGGYAGKQGVEKYREGTYASLWAR
jgi:hypothetical protein